MALNTCPVCGLRFKRLDRHAVKHKGHPAVATSTGTRRAQPSDRPIPPPPPDLNLAGIALWRAVTENFAVEPHLLATLLAACRETDRAEQAEDEVRHDGAYLHERSMKAHPGIAVARQARLAAARLLRSLDLEPAHHPDVPDPAATAPLATGRTRPA